ncbi:MAG TPA: hypothetical protein VJX29_13770 [Candidatus Acidoferrales bacterium]|nr:hypothetical protein [Candidatus Acidoferrales bacterium]
MLTKLGLLWIAACLAQAAAASPTQQPSSVPQAKPPTQADPELAAKLLKVKRIYVEAFGDDKDSKQLQAMVINALSESKRFIVTENREKADAVLKGRAIEKTSQEFHALGEGAAASVAAGSHHSSVSGSTVAGTGSVSGSSSGGFSAKGMAAGDSVASTETVNDARLAVRLVASDGDVIWSTTQESKGAKYKGASADVADKIVERLLRDLDRLESTPRQ